MATEKLTPKVLSGKNVLLIKATRITKPYVSETEGFKGKKYTVFSSTEGAFVVHEDDVVAFNEGLKARGEDQIAEVHFGVNSDAQLSLVNWLTWGQINSMKLNEVKNESITVENFRPVTSLEHAESLA